MIVNKVNFKLFLIIDLLLFTKLLELLAINYSLSESRSTFVEVHPCSSCFITYMGVHFPTVELDDTIQFSTLPGCQGSCGMVTNGPAVRSFP